MWLIALAVPVQGSAAVTMFGCGPGHHHGMGSVQTATAIEHALGVGHHPDGIVFEDAQSHHAGGVLHDHSKALGTAHKVAKSNCASCASCCVVAVLPATVTTFDPVLLGAFFVTSAPSSVSSLFADGLERPPRLLLV